MFRTRPYLLSLSLLFASAVGFGQPRPAFEVASIKPAEPLSASAVMSGQMKIGMTIDNAMVHITSMSLVDMLRYAYKVKTFQISGPPWLASQRFNITAKMPEGANRDQVPAMVQSLLAERFKVIFHRETTEQPAYALVVMKGGVKLKESPPDLRDTAPGDPAAPQAPTPTDGGAQVRAEATSNSSGGINMRGVNGESKMTPTQNGSGMHVELTHMNTAGMMEFLGRFIERPIIDATELKGRYDLTLDIGLEDLLAMARSAGVAVPFAPGGAGANASDPGTSSVFTGIQQYGLKLEPRKASVELLVIDHVEKLPTEN